MSYTDWPLIFILLGTLGAVGAAVGSAVLRTHESNPQTHAQAALEAIDAELVPTIEGKKM